MGLVVNSDELINHWLIISDEIAPQYFQPEYRNGFGELFNLLLNISTTTNDYLTEDSLVNWFDQLICNPAPQLGAAKENFW